MTEERIIQTISDMAVASYDPEIDGTDLEKVTRWILSWYSSLDAPEPVNGKLYQKVIQNKTEKVYKAIYEALQLSFA